MESAIYCGMESKQRSEWNYGNAVYGIKPQGLYFIRASRDYMRDFVGVPYNARGALIPYQAYGYPVARIKSLPPTKKRTPFGVLFVGGEGEI